MANYAVSCSGCKLQTVCTVKRLIEKYLIEPHNHDLCPNVNIRCECKRYIHGNQIYSVTGYSTQQNFCEPDKFMDKCTHCKTRDLCTHTHNTKDIDRLIYELTEFLGRSNISDYLSFDISCIAYEK